MKITVTGAGGFIGSHLCKRLKEMGHYVKAVDIEWRTSLKDYADEYTTLDLRDPKHCRLAIVDREWVFHLAADMGGMGYLTYKGADVMHNNQTMNLNMLNAAATWKVSRVKRFFFASSACVYPEHLQLSPDSPDLKESDAIPANPDLFYGWEKLMTEKVCEAYKRDYNLDIRIARFHNVYGPGCIHSLEREKAPASLIRKAIESKNKEIEVWGDGKQTRSFLYIDDAVDGIINLMQSNCDMPLNIGSNERVTIDKLAEYVIGASGKDLKIKHIEGPQGVRGRNSDNTLSKQILNWEPKVSLKEGIERTYGWMNANL